MFESVPKAALAQVSSKIPTWGTSNFDPGSCGGLSLYFPEL